MKPYCDRCGGIFSKDMTIHEGDDDKRYHYYCAWKIWQEKLRKESDQSSNLHKSFSKSVLPTSSLG